MSFPHFFGKKEKPKYFLALILREDKANAVLFEEREGKVKIISQTEQYFPSSIEDITHEELLETIDAVISSVETILPHQIKTHQTIFGLKENWIEGTTIKKDYLAKLKKICDVLGLAPIGFMVIPEAIAHFLQKEEGAPVSAILVEIGRKKITASLIRAGRVIETRMIDREKSTSKSVDSLLKFFESSDILPSRIILFDDSHKDSTQQEFIAHQWSRSLPFLHVPQTTTLPKDFVVNAVIVASATQLGFQIIGKPIHLSQPQILSRHVKEQGKQNTKEEIKEQPVTEDPIPFTHVPFETFGFIKGKDISQIPQEEIIATEPEHEEEYDENKEKEEEIEELPTEDAKKSSAFNALIKKLSFPHFLRSVTNKLGNIVPEKKGRHSKALIFFPLIILVCILLLLAYLFGIHARVILSLKPKTLEQTQDVTFSTTIDSDFSKNIIHATLVKTTKDGTDSTQATGKKEIGNKAKGSVTIYSRFPEEKTFPAGTVLTFNNLYFAFDSPITVASTSADASAQPSTAKISVTATQIGKESNLPSGTKFTIGDFPSTTVIAKNDSAFSGGSKKEITVVSKEDVDKLTAEIPKSLEDKAKDDLGKVVSSDSLLLPAFIDETLIKKDLNKQIGEETKTVTLRATVEFQGLTYKKDDLTKFGQEVLQNRFPSNLSIAPNGIRAEVASIKQKNDKEVIIVTKLQALLLPNINTQILRSEIAGKSFLQAEDSLLKLLQVSDVQIILQPNIPLLPKMLPRISGNIQITTKVNE